MKRPSWIKLPETKLGMIALSAASVTILSAGTISALAISNTNNGKGKTLSSTQTTQTKAVTKTQTSSPDTKSTETPTAQDTTTKKTVSSSTATASTSGTVAADPQPTAPETPTYTDTYPEAWKNSCSQLDTWSMNKCQSTSYTAWKVNETFGNMPNWGVGRTISGDAQNWPTLAAQDNVPTGNSAKIHSVAIRGNWSVWVEAVNTDGTIDISFYNLNNSQAYGTQLNVPQSAFSTYIYFS